ncbi:cleft lip and palate transmembrane 1 [Guyanagaster necrorhizus]|uniref:Cleft lip and palate transmembrane 1 n=1 Tax=Guyanagaster necrorhizus TaxID=856835 RepID=A0A9P7VVT9_9AGAR|nr:cleft lip and palate transmembrane 1 [Guyanagaster necrorhizus MCA 3950]KAG7447533.1 cleft lip and palate transmembrane 1 [Guyanagaster necrorhizus MCA 3950]
MSTAQAPAVVPATGGAQQEETGFRKFFGFAQQIFIFWAITQIATKFFAPKTAGPDTAVSTGGKQAVNTNPVDPWSQLPTHASLAWPLGETYSMHVYFTTAPHTDVFTKQWRNTNKEDNLPHFVWDNIKFGDYNDHRSVEYTIDFPDVVKNNGSLWADIFLLKNGATLDPSNSFFDAGNIHHVRKLLTPYFPREKVRKEKNLLSGETAVEEEAEEVDVIVPHWHSNITLALISDPAVLPYSSLPPPILEHIHLVPNVRDETGTKGLYKPIIFPNEFWHLRSHYVEVNSSTEALPVQVVFQPMSYMKFQLFATMTQGFKDAEKQQGTSASAEIDEIKRMLLETNPWFLGLTGLVSVLHVLFEMLAFKSDVSHWRQKKEMVGVSVRTIVTNVFVQIVILLYLIDNNENTSWMILFGSGMGVLIEAWKITKAVDISLVSAPTGSLIPYKLDIKDKHVLSEDEKKTQEYDKLAFRYVSYAAIPLLAAYTVYSLVYNTHKGWYSFVISTLTSFVYMFGFAQLVPQLIINYKLKSVAHMPMKSMIYKTLSTVVDDLFAFCIKMPFLHRLACFRDDVVFLIFLYQRWIYRIDPKRVNEYGQVMVEEADAASKESKKTR